MTGGRGEEKFSFPYVDAGANMEKLNNIEVIDSLVSKLGGLVLEPNTHVKDSLKSRSWTLLSQGQLRKICFFLRI